MVDRPILCLVPVKNEEWILDRFIRCARLWADKIVMLDQGSEDSTRKIATSYKEVLYRDVGEMEYNEGVFRRLLIETARDYSRESIMVAIDADEALSSGISEASVIKRIRTLEPGTGFSFMLTNIDPEYTGYWEQREPTVAGFVDDGPAYEANWISTPRFPLAGKPVVPIPEVRLLHFQYTDWARMESKQRWYKVKERINEPGASAIRIYRRYTHMYRQIANMKPLDPGLFAMYESAGIDMRSMRPSAYWWDRRTLEAMKTSGLPLRAFLFLDVVPPGDPGDPEIGKMGKAAWGRLVRWYLRATTMAYPARWVRVFDKLLRLVEPRARRRATRTRALHRKARQA